jgi:hypothetical protein
MATSCHLRYSCSRTGCGGWELEGVDVGEGDAAKEAKTFSPSAQGTSDRPPSKAEGKGEKDWVIWTRLL